MTDTTSRTIPRPTLALTASAATAVVLACATIVRPLPWPLYAAWAALTAVAAVQAARR